MDSTDPIALVTGAGRGIGRSVAVRLGREGHRVVLTSRNVAELEETASLCERDSWVIPADITSPESIEALFSQVEADWGSVDVLVANAGAGLAAPIHKTTDDQWFAMLDLNLTAPFRCIRRAVPPMLVKERGRIVVIASVAAKQGEPYIAAYTASKHGVLGVVRATAAELAKTGVTVNAVCPGYVDTPMTEETVSGIVAKTGRSSQDARAALEAKQANGRLVAPDEVAEAVWACVANGAINGQGINVDGGGVQS